MRSTSISILDASGIEGRQIIRISGHKNESSIKSYSRNLTSAKKREISSTLSRAVGAENTEPEIIHFDDDVSDNMLMSIPDELPEINPIANDFFLLSDQVSVNSSRDVNDSSSNNEVMPLQDKIASKPAKSAVRSIVHENQPQKNEQSENVVINFSPRNTNTLMRAININNSVVNIYYQN